jgi:Pectinacetylesterase
MKHLIASFTQTPALAAAAPTHRIRNLLSAIALLVGTLATAQPINLIPAGNATGGAGTALYRHIINSPNSLCNDGSPAVAYVQTATNAANVNDWVIAMEGGGSCKNAQECLDRWQGLGGGIQLMSTQISRITWNTSRGLGVATFSPPSGWEAATIGGLPFYVAPARVSRGGMFANVAANPFAGWNKVFLNYCSSDNHIGRNPLTNNSGISRAGAAVAFNLQFRGADIFDGLIADLRAGFTACAPGPGAACQTMPTLNSATNILLTGSSAGSQGAQDTLDFFRTGQTAVNANTVVRGVFDAGSGPLRNELPYSQALSSFVSYQADMDAEWKMMTSYWQARTDQTCFDLNAELRSRCADHMHLQRHHITTSFFFHQDLLDHVSYPKILSRFFPEAGVVTYPAGTAAWELSTGSLENLQDLSMYREFTAYRYPSERLLITGDPQWIPSGIFAPRCQGHVALSNSGFFNLMLPVGGVPTNLATALTTWLATAPAAASTITAYATPGIGPAGGAGVCF